MSLEWFLRALARTSIQAGVLVLIILLVQWLFQRRMPPRLRASLWLLVIARLLLPIAPGSPASLFNYLPPWEAKVSRVPIEASRAEPFAPAIPTIAHASLPSAVITPAKASVPAQLPWTKIVFGCWLVGSVLLSSHVIIWSVLLGRRLRRLPVLQAPSVQFLFQDCARQMQVEQRVRLVESGEILSPVLHGLTRPSLVLPMGFFERHGSQATRFVFLHELAHLKRQDLLCHWVVTGLQIVYWFNPLIWIGFYRWRVDRELACDAMAIEAAGGNQSREYGRTLLNLLDNLGASPRATGLIGMLEGRRDLRRRMETILRFRPGQRGGFLTTALVAGLAIITLTNAQAPKLAESSPSISNPKQASANLQIDRLEANFSQRKANLIKLGALWIRLMESSGDDFVSRMAASGISRELLTLLGQLNEAEIQRSTLNRDLGPDHPEVQKVELALSTLKEQIAREAKGSLGYLKLKFASECAVVENIVEEIAWLDRKVGKKQVVVPSPGTTIDPQAVLGLTPEARRIADLEARRAEAIASFRQSLAMLHGLLKVQELGLPEDFPAVGNLPTLDREFRQASLKLSIIAPDLGPEHPDTKRLVFALAVLREQIGHEVSANLPEALRSLKFYSDRIDAVQVQIEAERNRQ